MTAASSGMGAGAVRATLAALCANLVGIGLARFAYTPLLPALIDAGWFAPAEAAYLGAANLAGYLVGALLARATSERFPVAAVLRAMMLLAAATFFASAAPLSFVWFFAARFASGVAGGALMVLAATTVLPLVPVSRRGVAGGVIFTGVGIGVVASGTLVPLAMRLGLVETWLVLGALSLILTAVAWSGWPADRPTADARRTAAAPVRRATAALRALFVEYALIAVALVPHMVFFVDFVVRGLGQGLDVGGGYWVLFGAGAAAGPVAAGRLADRIGFGPALRLLLAVEAVCIALPAVATGPAALAVSSFAVGAFVPGVVPLALGRVHELVPDGPQQKVAWGYCTAAFALGQAAAAYALSFLYAATASYLLLFGLGAAALLLALAVDVGAAAVGRRRPQPVLNGGLR